MNEAGDVAMRSASVVGAELVALFERACGLPDKVQWVHDYVVANLPGALDATLERAGAVVAAAIDAQASAFDSNPYHNRQHFCEVVLTAHALCLLNGLDAEATQFVVVAALIHDLVHDGGSHPAFVQERASIERARPLLESSGLQPLQLRRMAALVLATDLLHGTAYMAAACKAHEGQTFFASLPSDAPELALLAEDPELAMLARILCEADVLPSVGLDMEYAMQLQKRLSSEWRRPLDREDKLAFIDLVLNQGYIGHFFLPNIQLMREALVRIPHASEQR